MKVTDITQHMKQKIPESWTARITGRKGSYSYSFNGSDGRSYGEGFYIKLNEYNDKGEYGLRDLKEVAKEADEKLKRINDKLDIQRRENEKRRREWEAKKKRDREELQELADKLAKLPRISVTSVDDDNIHGFIGNTGDQTFRVRMFNEPKDRQYQLEIDHWNETQEGLVDFFAKLMGQKS